MNQPDAKSCRLAQEIVPAPKIPLHVDVDRAKFVRGFRALQAAEPREWKRATVTLMVRGSAFSWVRCRFRPGVQEFGQAKSRSLDATSGL